MAMSYTYDDPSRKEDLLDAIMNIDPVETYLTSNLGTVTINNTFHEWLIDTLTAQSTQSGIAEGADTTYAVGNPSRSSNITQIIEKGFKVSKTQQNVDHAGFSDRFAYEQSKKMKEWKNQLEFSVLRGTVASGDGSTARTMKGIKGFASTLTTTQSGVSLSETQFNDYLGNAWDNGAEIDTILVGKVLKRRISGWTAGNTRNIDAKSAELVGRIDVYDSDFGRVKVVKHRYMTISGDTNYDLLGIQSEYIKIGYLDKPHFEERPASGYYVAGSIVGEATVQVGTEKAVLSILKQK